MDVLLQDLRQAARMLLRTPAFTLLAALTLALGIGAATTLFSAVDALLLRPLPFHEPGRLVDVDLVAEGGSMFPAAPVALHREMGTGSRVLAGVGGYTRPQGMSVQADGAARVTPGSFATDDYFRVLGARPEIGRLFVPGEDAASAVLSYPLWRGRFGGDPRVLGRSIRVNGQPAVVVGVASREMSRVRIGESADLWLPVAAAPAVLHEPGWLDEPFGHLELVGRLRPGVTRERAEAALSGLVRGSGSVRAGPHAIQGVQLRGLSAVPWHHEEDVGRFMGLLAAATGLILLIACVNVAGMLLARATARRQETAIRAAIGAGRGRLVRQLLTEGTLLALLGGALGVLATLWMDDLAARIPWQEAVALDLSLDARVLAFALLLSAGTGVLFSLAPALQASRPDLVAALKGSPAGRAGGAWLRRGLVAGQVALSLLLLVGAGLFLRALQAAWSMDPGFRPDRVMAAELDLAPHGYEEADGRALLEQLGGFARELPGVEAASVAFNAPFAQGGVTMFTVEGHAPREGDPPPFGSFNTVDPDHFRTLSIPLLRGRSFTAADREGAPQVVVINETMARKYWPGGEALGKRMVSGGTPVEVVGIVGDVKTYTLNQREMMPQMYRPIAQMYPPRATLLLRLRDGAGAPLAAVRAEMRRLDPEVPPPAFVPLREVIGATLLPQRMGAALAGAFGAAGLLLACFGIYGAMTFWVGERTREIGIRMALGARGGSVLGMVLRQGVLLAALGIAAGLLAAAAATRLIGSLLYGVSATDPLALAGAATVIAAAATLAAWLPARRATRVDPMTALRTQ